MSFLTPKYILRLDDANHFSNFNKWNKIEKILKKYDIKPIVAVIPQNQDLRLQSSSFNKKFWEKVRNWERKGWSIAAHGYTHKFHSIPRNKLYYPFYNFSELAGLSLDDQKTLIKKTLNLFKLNKIIPKIWISPAHSFDLNTLKALKASSNIRIISDGIALKPFFENEFYFIPQQLWEIKQRYCGTWTICFHPDTMSDDDFIHFEEKLKKHNFYKNFLNPNDIKLDTNKKTIIDIIYSKIFWIKYYFKIILKIKKIDLNDYY